MYYKPEARDLLIKVQIEDPISKEWQNAFVAEKSSILAINIPIFITVGYSIYAFNEDPNSIKYRIEINYKDIYNKPHLKNLNIIWNRDNTWSYINE